MAESCSACDSGFNGAGMAAAAVWSSGAPGYSGYSTSTGLGGGAMNDGGVSVVPRSRRNETLAATVANTAVAPAMRTPG